MPVTVDHRRLAIEELGLQTVGEVLSHLMKEQKRLVIQVLIDGKEPEAARLPYVRKRPIAGHHLQIETTDPRQLARDVLKAIQEQLGDAEKLKNDTIKLLDARQHAKAMEKFTSCIATWQHSYDVVTKTAKLLTLNLNDLVAGPHSIAQVADDFAGCLNSFRAATESRDFPHLLRLLTETAAPTMRTWRWAIQFMRQSICD